MNEAITAFTKTIQIETVHGEIQVDVIEWIDGFAIHKAFWKKDMFALSDPASGGLIAEGNSIYGVKRAYRALVAKLGGPEAFAARCNAGRAKAEEHKHAVNQAIEALKIFTQDGILLDWALKKVSIALKADDVGITTTVGIDHVAH